MGWSEDAAQNRDLWTKSNAEHTDANALASWGREPKWGMWNHPDELGIFDAAAGLDARRCMRETGIEFPLVEAGAAATGLSDAPADLVVSEYGASIWADWARKWAAEDL